MVKLRRPEEKGDMSDLPPWRRHTARFQDRVLVLGATTFDFLHPFLDDLPAWPISTQLSDRAALKFQVCLVTIGSLRSAREVAFSTSKLWLQGHFLLAATGFRMLQELYGQLCWLEQKVLRPIEAGDLGVAHSRAVKAIFGSNTAIPHVRGGVGPHPLVNVMDFIRAGEAATPGVLEDWRDLSHRDRDRREGFDDPLRPGGPQRDCLPRRMRWVPKRPPRRPVRRPQRSIDADAGSPPLVGRGQRR